MIFTYIMIFGSILTMIVNTPLLIVGRFLHGVVIYYILIYLFFLK